ncbi:MAG: transcriptional coactivator p15/PC4 family protein [Candidatus Tectomicrobia bacterium]|uniref:Transcriptional coactivator p15/PC4 family protein n=1 Tax=Tectimicrobiota bacterium TaxID=2528274 RepID=A0A933GLU1_UNCTE|nr:transcriptional coactivator p15/PC4 family protein [Candidatus Tectomicrobia bacterium]
MPCVNSKAIEGEYTVNDPIASFTKNSSEEVRITLEEFKGHKLLDLRVWYEDDNGEKKPTKKGISISTTLFPELKAALEKAEAVLREKGLIEP